MRKKCSTFITLFVVFLVSAAGAQEKYTLTFRYGAGETYRYSNDYSYDMTQEMNGQEMKMNGSSSSIIKLFTESVAADGNISFIISYEQMKISMKSAMMDTTLDQNELIGKRGKVIISKFGKELGKEVIDSIKSEKGLGGGGVSALYTVNFLQLPDYSVGIGDKWVTDNIDTAKIGEGYTVTNSHNEYTILKKEEKDGHACINIGFTSRTETTGKIFQMGFEMFVEGSGDTQGAIWFDPASGILVEKESNMNVDMTYALTGQMKMTIPSSQRIRTTYKLLE